MNTEFIVDRRPKGVLRLRLKLEGKLIGRVFLLDIDAGVAGYISHLSIGKPYRKQGYGLKLLNEALSMAKATGCQGISLHVYIHNEEAIRLYERVGFFKCCTTEEKNNPHYLMALKLD